MKIQLTNSIDYLADGANSASRSEFLDRLFCFQLRADRPQSRQADGHDDLFRIWLQSIERQHVLHEKHGDGLVVDRT